MSISKTISFVRLGQTKIQIRIEEDIYHFEGESHHVENVRDMAKKAAKNPDHIEELENFLVGKPRPFYGDFTINNDGDLFFRDYAEKVAPSLAQSIFEAKKQGNTDVLSALQNFQARLMLNRNNAARQDLYKFLEKNRMVITPKGYFLSYKAVARRKAAMAEDVKLYLTKNRFTTDTDYLVRIFTGDTKKLEPIGFTALRYKNGSRTIPSLDKRKSVTNYQIIGRIDALYNSLENNNTGCFVDKHTKTIQQNVGELIQMPRADCDDDPKVGCSYGLHVGNPDYVNSFANSGDGILHALVSPTDVIAVPYEDARKMRVCQYFIAGFSSLDSAGKIVPVEDMLFEDDFEEKEMQEVQKELAEGNFERYILPKEKRAAVNEDEMRELIQKRMINAHEITL